MENTEPDEAELVEPDASQHLVGSTAGSLWLDDEPELVGLLVAHLELAEPVVHDVVQVVPDEYAAAEQVELVAYNPDRHEKPFDSDSHHFCQC